MYSIIKTCWQELTTYPNMEAFWVLISQSEWIRMQWSDNELRNYWDGFLV